VAKSINIMPKETFTIYCTSAARDGKGGVFAVGQKLSLDSKEAAHKLLASRRFSLKEEDATAAKAKLEKAEKAKASDASKDAEIAALKKQIASAKK